MALNLSVQKSVRRQRDENAQLLKYACACRNEGIFNDFTVKVDKVEISVHRMVLACYSNFFASMFQTNMKEKYQGFIEIQGFNVVTIQSLIEFIYTGKIEINNKNVIDLLAAADFLQIDEVKSFCIEFLSSCLDEQNCFAILQAAKPYCGNTLLLKKIYQFIACRLLKVTYLPEFKYLDKDDMLSCLTAIDRSKIREDAVYKALVAWTKHNSTRKEYFLQLLKAIKLSKLSAEFLESVVLSEELVTENSACSKIVTSALIQTLKKQKEQKNLSKLVALGGSYSLAIAREIYTVRNEPLVIWKNLPCEIDYLCSVKLDNYIYSIGGRSNTFSMKRVWRKDITKKSAAWEEVASMNEKRQSMGAAVFHDKIVVAGGFSGRNRAFFVGYFERDKELSSVEYMTPGLNEWKTIASMNQRRCGNALVEANDCLYSIGGWCDDEWLSSVEKLQDLDANWQFVQPMRTPRRWFAAVNCNGEIYAIGGRSGEGTSKRLKSVEKYNPEEDLWVYVQDMNFIRSGASACVLQGRIFVAGGLDGRDQRVRSLECYDPLINTWSIVQKNVSVDLLNHAMIAL